MEALTEKLGRLQSRWVTQSLAQLSMCIFFIHTSNVWWASQVVLVAKNLPTNAGDITWFNPWIGRIPWRRAYHPTPVFLPGESQGQRSLVAYSPWGRGVGHGMESAHTHVLRGGPSPEEAEGRAVLPGGATCSLQGGGCAFVCWFLPTSRTHHAGGSPRDQTPGRSPAVCPATVPEPHPKSLGWDESGVT